jgi:hypothetical protein
MFARALGPFLAIVTVTAVVRASDMRTLLSDFAGNPVWPWVTGAFVLLIGLFVIALHQYWRSAPAVIVSVLGWFIALKGLFLLAFPQTYLSAANDAVGAVALWRTGFIVLALLGLYLTYVGWMPAASRPTSQPASSTPDLPRAA